MIELINNKYFSINFVWFPREYLHLGLSVNKMDIELTTITLGLFICLFRIYIKK